jgi:hypothetical protein
MTSNRLEFIRPGDMELIDVVLCDALRLTGKHLHLKAAVWVSTAP